MAEPSTIMKRAEEILSQLEKRKDERGVMADLRHGFSPATEYRAWPHLAPWCNLTNERMRRITLTVAAGFALHGRSGDTKNMGTVLRLLATGDGRGTEGIASFDGRFRRFLACRSAIDVCDHLTGVLRASERKEIGVDFAQLYVDLTYWGKLTKLEWAQEYWGKAGPTQNETEAIEEDDEPSVGDGMDNHEDD